MPGEHKEDKLANLHDEPSVSVAVDSHSQDNAQKRLKMAPIIDHQSHHSSVEDKASFVDATEISPSLRIKKLSEHARAPERASPGSAGYDIYSAATLSIPAGSYSLVATDISLAIPVGYYGRIAPRSGLALRHGIDVGAGVIDADYRGPLGIVLFNHGRESFEITRGDRIAQLILTKIITPPVEVVEDLNETSRGSGGFGSTGK